jgi:hypothetical protein
MKKSNVCGKEVKEKEEGRKEIKIKGDERPKGVEGEMPGKMPRMGGDDGKGIHPKPSVALGTQQPRPNLGMGTTALPYCPPKSQGAQIGEGSGEEH